MTRAYDGHSRDKDSREGRALRFVGLISIVVPLILCVFGDSGIRRRRTVDYLFGAAAAVETENGRRLTASSKCHRR